MKQAAGIRWYRFFAICCLLFLLPVAGCSSNSSDAARQHSGSGTVSSSPSGQTDKSGSGSTGGDTAQEAETGNAGGQTGNTGDGADGTGEQAQNTADGTDGTGEQAQNTADGTDGTGEQAQNTADDATPLRDATPVVLTPEASGTLTYGNDRFTLDASNTADGYIIAAYSGTNEKVKIQLQMPDGTKYTYPIKAGGAQEVYLLPGGSGTYNVMLLESASIEDNMYAIAFTQDLDVSIADEFSPFLHPNFYVDFTPESACVQKGAELAADCHSDLDVIGSIYHYVIGNVTYDTAKAESVQYDYTPDPDETLSSKTGICFDYASLMSAMLRSQRIPTKLEVGYAGDVYHAWISCYADEIGWIDNIIEFDGENWSLMDPTLAANNSESSVRDYIGDGSKYMAKYTY